MIQSMTAFASRTGVFGPASWVWDMRGVNGRGLEVRLRLPEGTEAIESPLRALVTGRLARGNITLSLRLVMGVAPTSLVLDQAHLGRVLAAMAEVQAQAADCGLHLAPATPAEILGLRGVILADAPETADPSALHAALLADAGPLIDSFVAMRQREGAALASILSAQADRIAALTAEAAGLLTTRAEAMRTHLQAALARVTADLSGVDEARLHQELALLAVKSDITEEIDRLGAHVAAVRDLIGHPQPAGRKLDFLAQELNREANTLCSKAQSAELTYVGLELKAVIDQMREQVQNVE